MNWSAVASELWARGASKAPNARALLVRVNADWTSLELLASPEWNNSIVSLDATSFEFEVVAAVSLAPWLDRLDALEASTPSWRLHAFALRFSNQSATNAVQARLDELNEGLRTLALALAKQVSAAKQPVAILTGLGREVGVVTVSSTSPGLVVPVKAGGERAYVSLAEGTRAQLSTEQAQRWLETTEGLENGYRGSEDTELWEVPEGRDALELIAAHLAGAPAVFPAPMRTPPPERPADLPRANELIAALEAVLAPQLTGADADELLRPGIGALSVAMQPWGFRLFFSEPRSVFGALFARPLARLELTFEEMKTGPVSARALVVALPHVPCLERRLSGRVFVSEYAADLLFDVDDHRIAGRDWKPERLTV